MRRISFFIFVLSLGFALSSYTLHAETAVNTSSFEKEIQDFQKKETQQNKVYWEKTSDLMKKSADVRAKMKTPGQTPESLAALNQELSALNKGMEGIHHEQLKYNVGASEFRVRMAQHRAEVAKKNLADFEERQRKTPTLV